MYEYYCYKNTSMHTYTHVYVPKRGKQRHIHIMSTIDNIRDIIYLNEMLLHPFKSRFVPIVDCYYKVHIAAGHTT